MSAKSRIQQRSQLRRNRVRALQSPIELLELRRLLSGAPDTWTGGAGDNQYTTAANWQNNTLPTPGQDIVFPAPGSGTQRIVTLGAAETIGSIQLNNTVLQGSTITLQGDLATDSTTESAIIDPVILTHNVTATDPFDLVVGGVVSDGGHGYGITFTGGGQINIGNYINNAGTIALSTSNSSIADTYTGTTTVNDAGNLYISGTLASPVVEQANAAVLANQSLGGLTASGSEFYPFDSATGNPAAVGLSSGLSLDRTSSIAVIFQSTSSYGQIDVTGGRIDLGDATLDDSPTTNFTPAIGSVFTLVFNQTGQPIRRTLNGLAEGAVTTIAGANYQVSYVGGADKNSLTLTAVLPPTHIALSASTLTPHVNSNVTLTATITGTDTNSDSPSGTVQFYQGTTPIGGPVALASGAASIQTTALLPGSDVINATYSGDTHFNGSNAVTDASTIHAAVASTVSFSHAASATVGTHTATLSATATDTASTGAAGLIYTWTLLTSPKGAKTPTLSANASLAAKTTGAHLYKDGTYLYRCTASDAGGDYNISDVTLTVKQKIVAIRVTPKHTTVAKGHTEQINGTLLDQFNHPIRAAYTVHYSVVKGAGTVSQDGIFKSARKIGSVLLEAKADGLDGTLGVSVV